MWTRSLIATRDLLLEVAEQFPPSTKIIAAAISPVDVDSDPGFGGEGSQFDRARIELAYCRAGL